MAGRIQVVDDRSPEQKDKDFLHAYPDKLLACRGDHHKWPMLRDIKKKHGNVRTYIIPETEGVVQIEMSCLAGCGKERWKVTGRNHVYEPSNKWHYNKPPGYSIPKDSNLGRHDFAAELFRRILEG